MAVALKQNFSDQLYTHEEYFAIEEQADYKSEYHQGEIVAMAGASYEHTLITKNICVGLDIALEDKPCQPLPIDLRVWIEKQDIYVHPDVVVVCNTPNFVKNRRDTMSNPTIIMEVLSKSTESYDRKGKFHAYWTLDTLEEYILIDQYSVRVEYFRRVDDKKWELLIFTSLDDILPLKSIDVSLPLNRIYRNVEFIDEK